jgi:hypothetical protein
MFFFRKKKESNKYIEDEFKKLVEENINHLYICNHYIKCIDMDESENFLYDVFEPNKLMLGNETPEEVAHRMTEISILYPQEVYNVMKDYVDYDFKIYPGSKPIAELIGESVEDHIAKYDPEKNEYELAEFESILEANNGTAIDFEKEPFKYIFCYDFDNGDIGIAEMLAAVYVYEKESRIIDTDEARRIEEDIPNEYSERIIDLYILKKKSILSYIEKNDSNRRNKGEKDKNSYTCLDNDSNPFES